MTVPTLGSARLRLVPLDADWAAAYTRFHTDAEASAHYGGPLSEAVALNRLASDIGGCHADDAWRWPAVHTYMNDDNTAARALVLRLGGVKVARPRFPDERERDLFRVPHPTET